MKTESPITQINELKMWLGKLNPAERPDVKTTDSIEEKLFDIKIRFTTYLKDTPFCLKRCEVQLKACLSAILKHNVDLCLWHLLNIKQELEEKEKLSNF